MHHPATLADVIAGLAGAWVMVGLATGFLLYLFVPLMMLTVTLNIRGIRKELRDIAEQLAMPSRRV